MTSVAILALVATLLGLTGLTGCTPGQRPTLVAPLTPTPESELVLDLPAAPADTTPLPPAATDAPLQATVDDALIAWATERNIAYTDSCALATPGPGQLCDSPTERDTVRLLGPSATEAWYVVRVERVTTAGETTGYRVGEVTIAGS